MDTQREGKGRGRAALSKFFDFSVFCCFFFSIFSTFSTLRFSRLVFLSPSSRFSILAGWKVGGVWWGRCWHHLPFNSFLECRGGWGYGGGNMEVISVFFSHQQNKHKQAHAFLSRSAPFGLSWFLGYRCWCWSARGGYKKHGIRHGMAWYSIRGTGEERNFSCGRTDGGLEHVFSPFLLPLFVAQNIYVCGLRPVPTRSSSSSSSRPPCLVLLS